MTTVNFLDSPGRRLRSPNSRRALVEKDGHPSAITKTGEEGGGGQGESRGIQQWLHLAFLGNGCARGLHLYET